MLVLLLQQVILFVVAILIGFGVGWWLFTQLVGAQMKAEERDNEELRHALTDAQVRRARTP